MVSVDLDKIKFTGANSGDFAVWNGSKFVAYSTGSLVGDLETGALGSVFAAINHAHAQYVSTGSTGSFITASQTGIFITTSMTGAFGGASGVDLTSYVTTGSTGNFVTTSQTGNFITTSMTGAFGGSGGSVDLSSYITTGQTGDFITTLMTGIFAATGDYVVASQTGNFLTNTHTGILASVFAPTGDYVEIIDNRVPAQYLPSYVDDILEFESIQDFCTQSGSTNNIYIISGCNSFWRWGSSQYVEIFASPGTSDSIPEGINNLYFTNE